MDSLIRRFDATREGDLTVTDRGIAYQTDMKATAAYDESYYSCYKALEDTPVGVELNASRCAMVARHAEAGAKVLDYGAGSGVFVRAAKMLGFDAKGYDINPATVARLKSMQAYSELPQDFDVVTFWDSLEHLTHPHNALRAIRKGAVVCVAIPLMSSAASESIRASKHYKPGEHLYYFTEEGFLFWMECWGFRLLEKSTHEVDAGREAIGAFAFKKDFPDYHDNIDAYKEMHTSRFYGSSATELHLDTVSELVKKLNPKSILDYGCGRSDLVAHFWRDGERQIFRYDPAIPMFKRMRCGAVDLVLCCDVMEHIPIASVDVVLDEVRSKGYKAFFTISTRLARAKLPDGRNAHVTLLTRKEWIRWVTSKYGKLSKEFPSADPNEILLYVEA